MQRARQLKLDLPKQSPNRSWGGKRDGAGRKPKGEKAGVTHRRRPEMGLGSARRTTRVTLRGPAQVPVHVTIRMAHKVWNLRSRRAGKALARAFAGGKERFGFRLIHFAVMGNHVHFLAEATDRVALARGMQGLNIRIARALNRMMGRHGRVLADRYHAHVLRTLTEVRHARNYLLNNARKHYGPRNGAQAPDPCTSTVPVLAPKAHLLRLVC